VRERWLLDRSALEAESVAKHMHELHCLIPTAAMTVPRATTETKTMTSLCESDFFAWANEQAFLLRAGKLSRAEIENIAEEIENMGQKREARAGQQADHPAAALAQMAVPAKPAWKQLELHDQGPARDVGRHLADNPSLRLVRVVGSGRNSVAGGMFPATCLWSYQQVADPDFGRTHRISPIVLKLGRMSAFLRLVCTASPMMQRSVRPQV
jgi:hypothetical protein